jgi:hypothetical protein
MVALLHAYGDRAMKTQAYFWIAEVCRVRESLCQEERPETPPEPDAVLTHRIETNPDTTARKFAHSLVMSSQRVVMHLQEGLGLNCFHF